LIFIKSVKYQQSSLELIQPTVDS
jgi:hypothetical protein